MTNLDALVSSRICHDLISPVGAIGNGIELLEEVAAKMPEITLISESVENAKAKLQYFRVCFGKTSAGAATGSNEMQSLGNAMLQSARVTLNWQLDANDYPRETVKLVFLLLLCVETALPIGGYITVKQSGDTWTIHAEATRLQRADAWDILNGGRVADDLPPAQVQFPIAASFGRPVAAVFTETDLTVTL